jgi:hypothetical protein
MEVLGSVPTPRVKDHLVVDKRGVGACQQGVPGGLHFFWGLGVETMHGEARGPRLEGVVGPPHPGIIIELVVKLLTTRKDDGDVAVWALVFFVDKRRVAEQGKCYLAMEWLDGQWSRRGWESDDEGEWTGLETLE